MLVVVLSLVTGCVAPSEPTETPTIPSTPTVAQPPTVTSTVAPASTSTPFSSGSFICDEDWQSLPVIPKLAEAARGLYQQGVAEGNDPRAFSKIGDGEVSTAWFLTAFDLGVEYYDLDGYPFGKGFRGQEGGIDQRADRSLEVILQDEH